jgi:hypothetical protein
MGAAGRGVAVLYLDFTSVEQPRIFCALKGLIRCISSFSNSDVDLTTYFVAAGRERNEGGPSARLSFFLLSLTESGLGNGIIE